MPRAARKVSETGVYHAMVRGINCQDIFLDDEDRLIFLEKLNIVKERSECNVYAYCLMNNHVHLLIAENKETIGKTMKRLGSTYVYWYNRKYDRVGHLFQGRYLSQPINTEEYLLVALRYIHQNPVSAGIVFNCAKYPWSSYQDYINPSKPNNNLTDIGFCLGIIGGPKEFLKFHQKPCGNDLLDIDNVTPATDALAEKLIRKVLGNSTVDDLGKMTIAERDTLLKELKVLPGVSQRQIGRITGISRNIIQRA